MVTVTVTVGNTTKRKTVVVPADTKLRTVLEDNGVDFAVGTTNLSGSTLTRLELENTFADFGVKDSCSLINVVKADNA